MDIVRTQIAFSLVSLLFSYGFDLKIFIFFFTHLIIVEFVWRSRTLTTFRNLFLTFKVMLISKVLTWSLFMTFIFLDAAYLTLHLRFGPKQCVFLSWLSYSQLNIGAQCLRHSVLALGRWSLRLWVVIVCALVLVISIS